MNVKAPAGRAAARGPGPGEPPPPGQARPRGALGGAWPAVIAVCATSACTAYERVPFSPGRDGDLVAVIELDESGAFSRATGLVEYSPGAGLPVWTRGGSLLVAAWGVADLEGLGAPEREVLSADPLELGEGCDARLPTPRAALRLDAGGAATEVDPSEVPPLGAPWLDDACPELEPSDFSFDLDCELFRCPMRVERRSRCSFEIDLDCTFGQVSATVWPGGGLCLQAKEPLACVPSELGPAVLSCSAPEPCTVRGFARPPPPPLTVDGVVLRDVPVYSPPPDLIGELALLPNSSRYRGSAYDFAISKDRVLVSLGAGPPVEGCLNPFSPGTVEVLDLESMERLHAGPSPSCLTGVAPDPLADGAGWIGVYVGVGRFWLTRFGPDGVALGAPVDADPRGAGPPPGDPPLLYAADARPTVFGIYGSPPRLALAVVSEIADATSLYTYDLETLAPLERVVLPHAVVTAATEVGPDTIALGDATGSLVVWVDLEEGRITGSATLPREEDRYDNFTSDVAHVPGADRLLLTISRKNAAVYGIDRTRGAVSRAVIFDDDARPVAAHAWPSIPGYALVEATWPKDHSSWPAKLALVDARTGRFSPGNVEIGHGPAGRITADLQGRVWILLPWEPRLVRVSPR